MTRAVHSLFLAAAFAGLAAAALPAQAGVHGGISISVGTRSHGHWHRAPHHHHRGHWHGWGPRIGIGIGIAAPIYYGSYHGTYVHPAYGTGTLLVSPPPVVYESGPVPPAPMTQPEPIFYPRNGQSAAQTEIDRRECNRWAIGQPNAMGDATVFHRATLACMEGKGYTVR